MVVAINADAQICRVLISLKLERTRDLNDPSFSRLFVYRRLLLSFVNRIVIDFLDHCGTLSHGLITIVPYVPCWFLLTSLLQTCM